jgi:Transcriptional regulators
MPNVERTPPYVQIANHYRKQIQDGELHEGDQIPSISEIKQTWSVATSTASKALSQLQVEGLVRSSPRGTFVENTFRNARSPLDRFRHVRKAGAAYSDGEWSRTLAAELVTPPLYVADLLDIGAREQVVRRESVTIRAKRAAELVVTWHPKRLADLVPELLENGSESKGNAEPLIKKIEQALGVRVTQGRDDMEAREADEREASRLGLKIGSPILCIVHRWTAGDELVEYGEKCLPPKHVVAYEYDLSEEG